MRARTSGSPAAAATGAATSKAPGELELVDAAGPPAVKPDRRAKSGGGDVEVTQSQEDDAPDGGAKSGGGVAAMAAQLRATAARAAAAARASIPSRQPSERSTAADPTPVVQQDAAPSQSASAPAGTRADDETNVLPAVKVLSPPPVGQPVFPVSHAPATGGAPMGASVPLASAAIPAPTRRPSRVRKARLRLLRVDPWSVMKTAFLLSIAAGVMLVVSVAVVWSVLDAAGVFSSVGDLVRDVSSSETNPGFEISSYIGLPRVLGLTTLLAVVDVVLITALATLGAFLYNLSASLLGGLEVTLAEDD